MICEIVCEIYATLLRYQFTVKLQSMCIVYLSYVVVRHAHYSILYSSTNVRLFFFQRFDVGLLNVRPFDSDPFRQRVDGKQ